MSRAARLAGAIVALGLLATLASCANRPEEQLAAAVAGGSDVRWVLGDSLLAVGLHGRGVELLDPVTGESRGAWRLPSLPSHAVHGLAASATGETLAVATPDSVRVFITRGLRPLLAAPGGGLALGLSGDGSRLAWSDGTVGRVLDVASGAIVSEGAVFMERDAIAWSPRERAFAWPMGRWVRFTGLESGDDSTAGGTLGPFLDGIPRRMAFSATGEVLAVAESTEYVSFWDAWARRLRWRLRFSGRTRVDRIAFSGDAGFLATAWEGRVRILWAYTGRVLSDWTPHRGAAVRGLAFAPDGRRLATVGADGHVRVWVVPAPRRERR